jgi:hypothetical protein
MNIEEVEESRIRSMLILYGHMVELNPLYELTLNLIRVANGQKCEKQPIPESIRHPVEKIPLISKENQQVGAIFNEFYSSKVRNAFAHSKYKIENGFFIKTDEDFSIALPEFTQKVELCDSYWRYISNRIAREQAFAMEKKVFQTTDGSTIRVSGEKIPFKS